MLNNGVNDTTGTLENYFLTWKKKKSLLLHKQVAVQRNLILWRAKN